MDVYVLLDILLLILVALFVPIGFWRGAFREAFVTLGILFGATLAFFWGETWGAELASVTRLHETGGAFMVAMLCLIGSTFLLGYSAGAAVIVPAPGWIGRSLGALIAALNGTLLLSFALRDIRIYLLSAQESDFLDSALIAPFLSEGTGWILLISAAVFVPVALVVALFGGEPELEVYYETGEYETLEGAGIETYAPPDPELRPAPVLTNRTAQRRAVPPSEQTRPIPVADDPRPASQYGSVATPPAGTAPVKNTTSEQQVIFGYRPEKPPEPRPRADDTVPAEVAEKPVSTKQGAPEPEPQKPAPPGTCPHCRADIGDAEGYCPNCGRVI